MTRLPPWLMQLVRCGQFSACGAALAGQLVWANQTKPCQPTVTGTLDLIESTSAVFHNERYLRVWTPPGYSDPSNADQRYPVLYMMDGQTLFDACTTGSDEWRIDETLTGLIDKRSIPPLIVVGIDQMGASRRYEYLPYRDVGDSEEPRGRQFPEFLARDVLPLVAKRYRVETGPHAIGGSSYGAVAALYALVNRPDLFNKGLIASPSLGVGNGQLIRDTANLFRGPSRIFLARVTPSLRGTRPANRGYVAMVRALESNLKNAALTQARTKVVILPGAKHSLGTWGRLFQEAAPFLFSN